MSTRNFTIDDVARAAGVARVTVSRVLNDVTKVRPATRDKVRRAIDELGYSVNHQARALASGMGRQIILVHAHSPELEPNSYYNAGLEIGALRACSSLGFDLVTRAVDPHHENRVGRLCSILERERPAGLILSPPLSDDLELIRAAQQAGVRVVAVSAGENARVAVSTVGIDERAVVGGVGQVLGARVALPGPQPAAVVPPSAVQLHDATANRSHERDQTGGDHPRLTSMSLPYIHFSGCSARHQTSGHSRSSHSPV